MAKTRPRPARDGSETVPVSIRFSRRSLQQIRRLAGADGDTTSNWIRRHALSALRREAQLSRDRSRGALDDSERASVA